MTTLRSKETEERYKTEIDNGLLENGCALCKKEALKEFKRWKILLNDFPYDAVAQTHHMLVPKRHLIEKELPEEEREELQSIKDTYLSDHYDYMVEATHKTKSIPGHFHLHLLLLKTA
jgi:diadenosine tetraphosphate (Ap4A) HIT family hydrolase